MWFEADMPLLLIFFLTPIVEMYLLIEVAGYINALPTIFLVMLTAVIGVALLKRQGLATLTRGVGRLNRGEIPATEMAEGILLGISGALMITPGFITDGVGFLLLFPPSRTAIARLILDRMQVNGAYNGAFQTHTRSQAHSQASPFGEAQTPRERNVIEGEFDKRP